MTSRALSAFCFARCYSAVVLIPPLATQTPNPIVSPGAHTRGKALYRLVPWPYCRCRNLGAGPEQWVPMAGSRFLEGYRILLVEDEYFIADESRIALEAAGAVVVGPLASIAEAMAQARQDGFDLAVLDIRLRDGKCYELADCLTAQSIPFIFATGYDAHVIPERFSAIHRCEKPFDQELLMRALQDLVAGKAAT